MKNNLANTRKFPKLAIKTINEFFENAYGSPNYDEMLHGTNEIRRFLKSSC